MSRFINNIAADATRLHADAGAGWWTVTTDPSKVPDGGTVLQEWIDLSTLIQRLTSEQKRKALEALSLSNAELVKLIQDNAIALPTRFTKTEAITALQGDRIVLIGDGAINAPAGAKEGTWFSVFDPLLKLRSQSNKVIAVADQTIANGQLKTGVVATNEFNLSSLSSGYFGGEIVFVMGNDKNWLVSLAIANVVEAKASSNDKPAVSENTVVIRQGQTNLRKLPRIAQASPMLAAEQY